MPRKRRDTAGNSLSIAQTVRTEARRAALDVQINGWLRIIARIQEEIELMRADLHADNAVYTEVLNATDRALIDQVSAIVGNESLDRMAAIDEIKALIESTHLAREASSG